MSLNGLSKVHVELTSKCTLKKCWMCGRRKRDLLFSDQQYGHMGLPLLIKISSQLPMRMMVALHNNGEPLEFPHIPEALYYLRHCITYCVTNGLLLVEKADEIIGKMDILSISIIENEVPSVKQTQYEIIKEFLTKKGDRKPFTGLRFVGNIDNEEMYKKLNIPIVRRTLHIPEGSREYRHQPTIPEHMVCQDLLTTLSIDRHGDVSICVRYDIDKELVIGNLYEESLEQIWNGKKRQYIIDKHVSGKRTELPYCGQKCDYYGIPTGYPNIGMK